VERVNESVLVTLRGNTHPLAQSQFDQGAAPPDLPMARMLLILKRSDSQESALQTLLNGQQDQNSPSYHQWLTPDAFGQQFGPSDQDIQTVATWLQSHGFQVARISRGRTVIEFSGTELQVQQAFHTEIHRYTVNGEDHWANASNPQIPAALAPVVEGVASLHNFPKKPAYHLAGVFSKSRTTGQVRTLQPGYTMLNSCGGSNCYFLGPYDFAAIYNVSPLWAATPAAIDGTGQSIAILGESNINPQDVADFRNLFGLPPNVPNVIVDGSDPGLVSQAETEAVLDVEWSGAVAKGATINLVIAAPTEATAGVDLAAVHAVENNIAPIISESFLTCELFLGAAGNSFENAIREQAAAQGITFLTASGDQGSAGCDYFSGNAPAAAKHGLMVNGLATSPYGVAVGGTDFLNFGQNFNLNTPSPYWSPTNDTHQASALGYIPESTWNSTCTNGIFVVFKYGSTPEASCNNSQASNWVETVAGSGGKSNCITSDGATASSCSGGYPKPSWQSAPGVPADGARDIPDVSLFASSGFMGSAYIVCETDQPPGHGSCGLTNLEYDFLGVGGTSVSSPAFAGIMALVNQYTQSSGQGNANHVLYKLASSSSQTKSSCNSTAIPASTCIFYDVTTGTIATPCAAQSLNCTLSTAGDLYGVLSGYSAGAGYDLATGLGSVNAYNLVHGWAAPGISTTTAFSLNSGKATSITHGQGVSFSIAVSPSAATGDVSLLGSPASGSSVAMGEYTLQSGAISGTTTSLAGGTSYQVKAHYAGDSTYAPSDSVPVTVTVAPEPSTTLISIPVFDPNTEKETGDLPSSLVYGSPYIARVDVGNAKAAVTFPMKPVCAQFTCPTGSVTLTDSLNGAPRTPLGTTGVFPLNSEGYTEYWSIQLSGGTHQLSASYPGDTSYKASSATYSISVTPATMQLSLTLPASTVIGVPFVIYMNGTTTVVGAPPVGTLSIYDGSTQVFSATGGGLGGYGGTGSGSGPTATAGFGIDTAILLSTRGSHSLTMTYSGDPNYSAVSTSPQIVNVVYPTNLTLQSPTPSVNYGTSGTLIATLTTSQTSPPVTGQITFTSLSSRQIIPAGPATQTTINGFVALQATATFSPQSSDFYVAHYAGDSNYESAWGYSPYIAVNNPDFSVVPSQPDLAITAGQSGNLTMTITPTYALTSSVQFQLPSPVVQGVTCGISPAHIQLSGGGSVVATLTCRVPAPSSSNSTTQVFPSSRWPKLGPRDRWWKLSCLLAALAMAFWLLPVRMRLRRFAYAYLLLGAISFALGCGGGSSGSGGGGSATSTSTTLTVASTKVATSNLSATVQVTGTNSPTGSASLGVVGLSYSFNTAPLVNGTAQYSYYLGAPGAFLMTAQYSGDSQNLASQIHTPLTVVQTGVAGNMTVSVTIGPTTKQMSVPLTIQ
jgi:hypothetical protein